MAPAQLADTAPARARAGMIMTSTNQATRAKVDSTQDAVRSVCRRRIPRCQRMRDAESATKNVSTLAAIQGASAASGDR